MLKFLWRKINAESSTSCASDKRSCEGRGKAYFITVIAILLLKLPMAANAKNTVFFDIPQQAADLALIQFAEQANLTLFVPFDKLQGLRSNKLVGDYPVEEAISILLSNTGLSGKVDKGGQLSITSTTPPIGRESMYKKNKLSAAIFALIGAAFSGGNALAQDASTDPSDDSLLEEIVVTGNNNSDGMRKQDVSYSITTLNPDAIAERAPRTLPDLLKAVPGLSVESGGGHGSSDVRARGIPLDGFESLNLYEDGLPVLHDPAIGWLNGDQFLRHDVTIAGVEAVRGGPSAIYATNSPAGYINFLTQTGTETSEGLIKTTVSDYGTRRLDFSYTGPLSDDWFIAVGGHYNVDDGIRDTQFKANKGGQIRLKLSKEFEQGRFDIGLRRLDDNTHFQSGIPLAQNGNSIGDVVGFDSNYDTQSGLDFAQVNLKGKDGEVTEYRHDRGTTMEITQLTFNFEYEFENGIYLTNKSRYTDAFVRRENSFLWGNPELGSDYMNNNRDRLLAAFPTAVDVELRYSSDGSLFTPTSNGNGLVTPMGIPSVTMPHEEFVNDFRLSKEFEIGGSTHNVGLGFYSMYTQSNRLTRPGFLLLDVQNNSRRLDLHAVDAEGNVVGSLTDNGVIGHGAWYTNYSTDLDAYAIYASDEWQVTDSLRIDFGLRHEEISASGSKEQSETFDLGDPTTLADDAVALGNGKFDTIDHTVSGTSWSIGANYDINENNGVFARLTKNFTLPSNIDNTSPVSQPRNDIDQAEFGYKYSGETLGVFATLFYNNFQDLGLGDRSFDDNGNLVELLAFTDAETTGLELEAKWQPVDLFDVAVTATLQNAEYANARLFDKSTGQQSPLSPATVGFTIEGNQPRRLANTIVSIRPGMNLFDDKVRIHAEYEYTGKRYADDANTAELPDFFQLSLGAIWYVNESLTANINIQNLTNESGLVQGAPIVGLLQAQESQGYFTGRPIFGRNIVASFSLAF